MAILRAPQASALLLVLAVSLSCIGSSLHSAEGPSEPDVATLIALLSSEDFDTRADAESKLAAQGDAVRPALQRALTSSDVETRSIAARLLVQHDKSSLHLMAFDRNGKAVPGIEGSVQFWDQTNRFQRNGANPTIAFGPNGVAEVGDIRPGLKSMNFTWQKCWIVGAESYDGNSYYNTSINIRSGRTPFLFSFSKGGSVKGTIRDLTGKPVAEADLNLYHIGNFNPDLLDYHGEYQSMQPAATARSDAKGLATIESIGDGVYVCVGTIHGNSVVGETIRVREGQTTQATPIAVKIAKPGKIIFAPRGIINAKNKPEIEAWREQWNQNNGNNDPEKKKKEEKKDANAPEAPEPLKNIKMMIETEFLFEGPDGEKKRLLIAEERARYNRYREKQQYDVDEHGKITLDNLRAGKHRIAIECPGFAPKSITVDVPPDGTVELGEVLFGAGGSVSFKATGSDGKPVTDVIAYPIPENETAATEAVPGEVLGYLRGENAWQDARNYVDWQRQMNRRGEPRPGDNREKFTLKNIAPGSYSLLVYRNSQGRVPTIYLLCGVKIEEGKTTELPPVTFVTAPTPAKSSGDSPRIKGKVVGFPGEMPQRCVVYYRSQNSSTGSGVNTDGTFQIYASNVGLGGKLTLKVPGYKLAEFDCSAPGVDTNNIELKLEKQKYGDVRVRVVDEDGRPLSGATVDPTVPPGQNYNYSGYPRNRSQQKTTDAKGETNFVGLSIGARRIQITCDGYYLSEPVRVSIQKEIETQIVVMLRKGLEISGKLVEPGGSKFDNAVIHVRRQQDSAMIAVGVNAEGEYSIGGLSPDTYVVSADAPLFTQIKPIEVELIGESKRNQDIALVKKGGFIAQFDPMFKGRYAMMVDRENNDASKKSPYVTPYSYGRRYSGNVPVDAEGRAEFWGVKPGTYRLTVAPDARRREIAEKDGEKYKSHIECTRYSESFEVKEPKSYADLKIDEAVKISFTDVTASAVAKFVFPKTSGNTTTQTAGIQTTVMITVTGDNCTGQYYMYPRARSAASTPVTAKLRVIGALPTFLAQKKTTTNGATLIRDLVPGKYKIIVSEYTSNSYRGTQDQSEEVVAAEFEVKAGECKNLGQIIVEPSKSIVHKPNIRRQNFFNGNGNGEGSGEEDMDPAFDP